MNIIFFFILGAITGSFMNVCIERLPKKESIVTPRSHCPSCGALIRWFDNIPIISFFILKGRCKNCKKRISIRYVIVEALSGILALLLFFRFGITAKFFILWYLLGALIVSSFIDFGFHEIPDEVTLPGILIGLCTAALYPPLMGKNGNFESLIDSILGVMAGGLSIYILGFVGEFIFKREAMGGGDVKLLAMIGAFIGWKFAILTFFIAPFFGSIVGIILKLREGKDVIPYGPYLSLAAFVSIFFGEEILKRLFLI